MFTTKRGVKNLKNFFLNEKVPFYILNAYILDPMDMFDGVKLDLRFKELRFLLRRKAPSRPFCISAKDEKARCWW